MTLADILKPSLIVLKHAEVKGLQIGAGLGAAVALPVLAIRPSAVNPSNHPPLVALANVAGVGALAGATVVTLATAVKMSKLDAEGIKQRAEKLCANAEQAKLDKVAAAGAVAGLSLVALRVANIAKIDDVPVTNVALTKCTVWEAFAFSVLGAAVSVGAVTAGKIVVKKVKCMKEKANEKSDSELAAAARELGDDATDGIDAKIPKTAEMEEAVKEAIDSSVTDATE